MSNVGIGFLKTVSRPLTKESKTSLKEKIKIPENCKEFLVPKVNPEIWKLLPSMAKIQDIKQQQMQEVLSLSLASLTSIANTVATNKDKVPKEVVSSVIKQSLDNANILGDQFQAINSQRRWNMKRHLNPEYVGICSGQFSSSEWLFGSDLAESLKSSKATASLMRNTMPRNQRFQPYSRPRPQQQQTFSQSPSLNWRGPLYQQSRGSGNYQQMFQRQSQGQFRMLNPANHQFQQRHRKF